MKKLITAACVLLAVLMLVDHSYFNASVAQAEVPHLRKLREKMYKAKAKKKEAWAKYKLVKSQEKAAYSKTKKNSFKQYEKEKDELRETYLKDKGTAYRTYNTKRKKAWNEYLGEKGDAQDRYAEARDNYLKEKKKYNKCLEKKKKGGTGPVPDLSKRKKECKKEYKTMKAAQKIKNEKRDRYRKIKKAARAEYDDEKASLKAKYKKERDKQKKDYASGKKKIRAGHDERKAAARKKRDGSIKGSRDSYETFKEVYLEAKEKYEKYKKEVGN